MTISFNLYCSASHRLHTVATGKQNSCLSFFSFHPGEAQLVRRGFSGCLRDVSFKMADSPSEEWQLLDWTKAANKSTVYESWEGCPLQTTEGAHFLGHGRFLLTVS